MEKINVFYTISIISPLYFIFAFYQPMKFFKKIFFTLLFVSFSIYPQQNQWKGYFSYNDVKALSPANQDMKIAAQNAYYHYKPSTGEVQTMSSMQGLSGYEIVAFHYSAVFNKTILGFDNGILQIVDESTKEVINRIDITNRPGISLNRRKINHFTEHNGLLYIACDFGIVVFNLQTNLFGDTFFMGNGGAETRVIDTAIVGNTIYANTVEFGLKFANLTNANLIDFNNWSLNGVFLKKINSFQNQLIALGYDNNLLRFNGSTFQVMQSFGAVNVFDFQSSATHLTITSSNIVYLLNQSYNTIFQVNVNQISDLNSTFSTSRFLGNSLYLGTKDNGAIKLADLSLSNLSYLSPDGPLRNKVYAIKHNANFNSLWAVFGEVSADYDPFFNGLNNYGVSKWQSGIWKNIPNDELLGARSIIDLATHPINENEVYFASYHDGLLKMTNDEAIVLYNNSNSTYISNPFPGVAFRIHSLAFDKNNNLWNTQAMFANDMKKIHVLRVNGQWQSYDVSSTLTANRVDISKGVVDKNNTYWVASKNHGAFGFNVNANPNIKLVEHVESGMFGSRARSIAVDNRNQLWIGTDAGLRVLNSIEGMLSESELSANNIIIEENGVGQELFNGLQLNDIVVDGANNKWIGTASDGIYVVSPNGQQTLFRFTQENSPLPSNTIYDIDINQKSGEVFIATDRGLVSYGGLATSGQETLENVVVYPNPVRPNYEGTVKITGLTDRANVKITDVTGSLVFEQTAQGGTIEWDTTAFGSYKVASGVYMLFISTKDALETTVKKLLIVR